MTDLQKVKDHPREIELGFALGIFIGKTPTIGIQMPITHRKRLYLVAETELLSVSHQQ